MLSINQKSKILNKIVDLPSILLPQIKKKKKVNLCLINLVLSAMIKLVLRPKHPPVLNLLKENKKKMPKRNPKFKLLKKANNLFQLLIAKAVLRLMPKSLKRVIENKFLMNSTNQL